MVVAALVALVIGLPALRIRGPFLAVTTLAFAVTSATYFLEDRYFPWFIEAASSRPVLLDRLPLEQAVADVHCCASSASSLCVAGASSLRRSHTGRVLIAVRDNEVAAEAAAINTTRVKLTAFVISGAIAGFAGGALRHAPERPEHRRVQRRRELLLFSMVVIGGSGRCPAWCSAPRTSAACSSSCRRSGRCWPVGAGILFLLLFLPEGLGGLLYAARDAFLRWVARAAGSSCRASSPTGASRRPRRDRRRVAIGTALGGLARAAPDDAKPVEEGA